MDDPTRHLVEPTPVDPTVENGYANPLDVLDILSPTGWVNYGIMELTGVNVLVSLVQPLSGNWLAFSRYGDALRNLAPCTQDIGVNIQRATLTVDRTWHGNANDAAYMYFSEVAARTSGLQHLLREAVTSYENMARGMWQLAQQMANILQSVIDEFLIVSVLLVAGAALIETGVGTVAAWGLAAWRVARIIQLLSRASAIIQTGGLVILTFTSFIIEAEARLGDLDKAGFPIEPYDHPAVDWRER